jgi:cytoskeletal protein RodZ
MDIDDFLKQSIGQTEFDMKDAYWQSASTLLDRHYRRKMWIRRGFYASFFLLFLAGLGGIWQMHRQASVLERPAAPAHIIENQGDFVQKNRNSKADAMHDSRTKPTQTATGSASMSLNGEVQEVTGNRNSLNGKNNVDENQVAQEETSSYLRLADSASSGLISAPQILGKAGATGWNGQQSVAEVSDNSQLTRKDDTTTNGEEFLAKDTPSIIGNVESILTQENIMASHLLEVLPVSLGELDYPMIDLDEPFALRVDPSRFRPYWESMVFAQMLTFPNLEPSSKKVLGGQAGIEFRYSFHKNWFLRGALAAGVRNGSFAPSLYSTQRTYFLGPQDDAYVIRPTSLWYLGTPLQLGYRLGKNAFMAGITPQWLMGVYGNLEYARENLRQPASGEDLYAFERLESGWMNRGGMRRMIMTYTFSFSRQVHPRVHLGMTLQAIPADWVSEQYGKKFDFGSQSYLPVEFDERALVEKNWILSFNVHYRL